MTTEVDADRIVHEYVGNLSDRSLVAVLDELPQPWAIVGPDGHLVFTNRAWASTTESDEAVPTTEVGGDYLEVCRTAVAHPFGAELTDGLRLLLGGQRGDFRTTYAVTTPGAERWFDLEAWQFGVKGRSHALVRVLEVTEETAAERADRERITQLESLGHVLSHDLRNALSVADGYRALLADEVDSEHVERLGDALDRVQTTVENALFIARGATVEQPRTVDLGAEAERVWEFLDTGDATLRVTEGTTLEVDSGLFQELLENLFKNALDHAGPSPTVEVGATERGFSVADDGPGIPAEVRETVFELGYTTGGGGNSGFGLEIVERIAAAHGWTVEVGESASGGARFEVDVTDA